MIRFFVILACLILLWQVPEVQVAMQQSYYAINKFLDQDKGSDFIKKEYGGPQNPFRKPKEPCGTDIKVCPDGRAVNRRLDTCEFPAC